MEQISPDIEQWLLQDTQVVSRWRNLARHLGLSECHLETQPLGGARRRRRGWREEDKLQMLLSTWKEKNPGSYNIQTLKSILLAEGLSDMWLWMNIITKDSKRPPSRRTSPASSPIPSSPWSRYLYSPSPSPPYSFTSQSTYPDSEYSHSLSSNESRPASHLSDYKANSSSPSPSSFSPHPFITSSPSTPSMVYMPDLIQLSSPRLWMRQKAEDRARHASLESDAWDMSVTSDKWDSLEIIEHKNNPTVNHFFANEENDDQTKHAETDVDSPKIEVQSSILSNIKNSENFEECARNSDQDVINRVNKMNEERLINTKPYNSIIKIYENKTSNRKIKRVKFDQEDPCEKQFDFLLGMIQQSVKDLNV